MPEPVREWRRCTACERVDSFPVGWSVDVDCSFCGVHGEFVRVCACGCGEDIPGSRRKDARYVSGACRMRALEARRRRFVSLPGNTTRGDEKETP